MKFHFVEATLKGFPNLKYGYLLQIDNVMELCEYNIQTQIPIVAKAFKNSCDSIKKNYHTNNPISQEINKLLKVNDKSILQTYVDLSHDMFKGQIEALEKGPICFQKNGSWMPLAGLEIGLDIETEELIWPSSKKLTEKDIKITIWPGGNHFYVSVDGISLDKCNTILEAENKALDYINKHNKISD